MEQNSARYGVVLVTAASQVEGEAIAKALLTEKLAACVNITPVHSFYTWQGKQQSDREWQLIIKTNLILFSQLVAKIKELHSYEVPEIIALPIIAGAESYLSWLDENVKQ
ncbi:divalent-cation tolerance protein CutA [Pleurocapsales cyanobacterium LEGE 06147]|nr:divalent-cation tolerance protein CutA [Pleurocapsales cyanobacterium LEGE 06147]